MQKTKACAPIVADAEREAMEVCDLVRDLAQLERDVDEAMARCNSPGSSAEDQEAAALAAVDAWLTRAGVGAKLTAVRGDPESPAAAAADEAACEDFVNAYEAELFGAAEADQ